jgi:hypothetical protein
MKYGEVVAVISDFLSALRGNESSGVSRQHGWPISGYNPLTPETKKSENCVPHVRPIIKLGPCFHLPNGYIEEAPTKANTGPTSPIVAPGCGDGFIHWGVAK